MEIFEFYFNNNYQIIRSSRDINEISVSKNKDNQPQQQYLQ
jgi:hypothetical protein